jgi:hypothetical protein
MPIKAISLYTYRTRGAEWTAPQLAVLRFKEALKGEPIGKTEMLRVGDDDRPMGPENRADAFKYFGEMATEVIARELGTLRVVLVPIPDSASTILVDACRTAKMAETMAVNSPAIAADILRWSKEKLPARKGSTRDPVSLFGHLILHGKMKDLSRPYVLIDDLMVSGGHIKACAAFLRQNGATVNLAVCAARSDQHPPSDVFEERTEIYDDEI